MIKKFLYISTLAFILSSCGTTGKVATEPATNTENQSKPVAEQIIAPEGIEFGTYHDFKDIASYSLPISGKGFKATFTDGQQAPRIKYHSSDFQIFSSLNDFEGTLDEQFEQAKNSNYFIIKENSQISFKKIKIGKYNTAQFELYRDYTSGYGSLHYGYLVEHNNKATIIYLKDGYLTPERDLDEYRAELDKTIQYIIKTLEYV